jgi:hypothetical protein
MSLYPPRIAAQAAHRKKRRDSLERSSDTVFLQLARGTCDASLHWEILLDHENRSLFIKEKQIWATREVKIKARGNNRKRPSLV